MSDYTSDLHKAYVKISSWYQDTSIFYSMTEDESLDAYDFMYSTLRRFVDGPLPDETLTEEAKAERAAIEDMAPEVIAHLNSFISQAVFMPPIEEEEEQDNIMEQPDKQTIKNASFVLAGGACLLIFAGQLFSPEGPLPIPGFHLLVDLAIPLLCLWTGMLIRFRTGKPKWWLLTIVALAMIALYYCSFREVQFLKWLYVRFQWYGLICLGFLLPWEYLYEIRDKDGIKSFVLCVISSLAYCALNLVNQRMTVVTLPAPYEDLGVLLKTVSQFITPLALLPPIYFASLFAFSAPGLWLGEKKWFRWIAGVGAIIVFLAMVFNLQLTWLSVLLWQLPMLLVQPVTIYLIVVIYRIIRKLGKKELTWKEVFAI